MTEILEWTNEQVIRLINSYKARGMLWDPKHDLYRVQTAKYEAWCELAELYGCEITDLRKKFNSILASHRREKAKIRMGGRSTWFAYNHLSFLPNHMHFERNSATRTKSKKNSVEEEPMEEEHLEFETPLAEPSSDPEEYEDNTSHSPVHIIVKEEPEITPPTPPKYYRTVKTTMQERIHQRKLEKEKLERLAEKKRRLLERKHSKGSKFYTNKKDECDSFGEYIAISLRKHDERTRSMIKQAINNILFEQEMKKYSSGQYTVLYEGGDVNPLIVSDECEK